MGAPPPGYNSIVANPENVRRLHYPEIAVYHPDQVHFSTLIYQIFQRNISYWFSIQKLHYQFFYLFTTLMTYNKFNREKRP
jgi:hypothetical protein